MLLKTNYLLHFGDYVVDRPRWSLHWRNVPVTLNPKTFDLLLYLIDHRERVVTKDELLQAMWPGQFVEESNLTQHIFLLRKALARQEPNHKLIETVPGRGYRFTATVTEAPGAGENRAGAVDTGNRQQAGARLEFGAAATPSILLSPASPGSAEEILQESSHQPSRRSRRNTYMAAALGLCVALSVLLLLYLRLTSRPPRLMVVETRRLTNDGMPKDPEGYSTALISDGRRLYFTEVRDNRSAIAQVPIEGGDVQSQVGPFPNAAVVDYSSHLQQLLIGSTWNTKDDRPILAEPVPWMRSADAGPRQIGELTGHDATWSPTADRIAFAKGRFLYIANADGSNVRSIAGCDGIISQPRWSPDGRTLRFTQLYVGLTSQLWQVNADGTDAHQMLLERPEHDRITGGNWSADGRYFFYLTGRGPSRSIWALPTQSTSWPARSPQPFELVVGAVDQWSAPVPSADGHRLWAIGKTRRGELDRIDPTSRSPEAFFGGISAEGFSVSPDGAWIAYTAYPEGTLWRSRVDGSDKLQLSRQLMVARFPHWSPDGKTIAYLGATPDSEWRLYIVSSASGKSEPLIEDDASEGVPSWSPDGKEIAFGRLLNYGAQNDPNLTIEIVDVARRSRTTLHNSAGLWTPRWSPDGRYFTAVTQDNRTLRLYNIATREWSDLAGVGVNDVVWSPDSRYVYFDTTFGADSRLYRVEIASRKLEQWANLSGFHRGGFFGPWLGMSPDGSPLLLRDTSIQEVYQLSLEPER